MISIIFAEFSLVIVDQKWSVKMIEKNFTNFFNKNPMAVMNFVKIFCLVKFFLEKLKCIIMNRAKIFPPRKKNILPIRAQMGSVRRRRVGGGRRNSGLQTQARYFERVKYFDWSLKNGQE